MNEQTINTAAWKASDSAQRRSLLALGGAFLMGRLSSPEATSARKGGNRKKGQQCKKQVGQCREGLAGLCEAVFGVAEVEECVALFAPCCESLKGCHAAQALTCAADVASSIAV